MREVARLTGMDPWFLHQMKQIADELQGGWRVDGMEAMDADDLQTAKRMGISDERLAAAWELEGAEGAAQVRALRKKLGVRPVYKLVDTCAAEFESFTPYLY